MPAYKVNLARLRRNLPLGLISLAVILSPLGVSAPAWATGLTSRSLQLSNDSPGASATYTFSFTITNSSTLGSLEFLLCSNSPLQDDSCTLPAGLDVTPAHTVAASGIHDFTVFPAATNELIVSWLPEPITAPLPISLTLSNIINPGSIGSYYTRISAFSSGNATGTAVDYGGLAFAITNNLQITSVVPPYLTFCSGLLINDFDCSSATGDYVNFGNLSSSRSSQADSQLLVATNAPNGYVIQVYGTTMTSGNNIINAITDGAGSRPGTSQFGINLRANSVPAIGADPAGPGSGEPVAAYANSNHYEFVSNDTVASSPVADNFRKYTVSYVVNTAVSQAPGIYASTLTYVCAGSF